MTRKRNVKIVLSEDEKVYRLIEILGRKNPHINTVAKIKNLIVERDSPEDVMQGAVDALMFRFELSDAVKDEALRFIEKIKNFNNPCKNKTAVSRIPEKKLKVDEIEKQLWAQTQKSIIIQKTLDDNSTLLFQMANAKIPYTKIYEFFNFSFSISAMKRYILKNGAII